MHWTISGLPAGFNYKDTWCLESTQNSHSGKLFISSEHVKGYSYPGIPCLMQFKVFQGTYSKQEFDLAHINQYNSYHLQFYQQSHEIQTGVSHTRDEAHIFLWNPLYKHLCDALGVPGSDKEGPADLCLLSWNSPGFPSNSVGLRATKAPIWSLRLMLWERESIGVAGTVTGWIVLDRSSVWISVHPWKFHWQRQAT